MLHPFGMLMAGRKYTSANSYRYGFNGKENDNEVKGEGNQQDYGMRVYDPRLGMFLSIDFLTSDFPYYTPYQFSGNTPIQAIDLDGGEPKGYKWTNPYVASHPGSGVKFIPSQYDNQAWMVGINGGHKQLMHIYAVQDINDRTYLIFETATGAKKEQWYYEYDKNGFKGDVNSFTWSGVPNSADLLTAIIFIPMIALPAGTTAVGGFILKEVGEEALEQITGLPIILDPVDIVEQAFKKTAKKEFKESAQKQLKTFLKNNLNEPLETIKNRLKSSIESFKKRVAEHKQWIKDPKKKYGDKWDTFSKERKEREIHHWEQDIKRNEANQISHEETLKRIEQNE